VLCLCFVKQVNKRALPWALANIKMTRIITTFTLLFIIIQPALADYGTSYFFKCEVILADTSFVGYFSGPYEGLYDSTLNHFKSDNEYFRRKLLRDIKNNRSTSQVSFYEYIHLQKHQDGLALFASKNSSLIGISDIIKLRLIEIIAFPFEPSSVTSELHPNDTTWSNQKPKKIIKDEHSDECCPEYYYVYDDNVPYIKLIDEITVLSDDTKRKILLEHLREYRIVSFRLCWCG
jgi:hypothetical protein